MYGYSTDKIVRVVNYGRSYRNISERIDNGSIVIRNSGGDIVKAVIKEGEIAECRVKKNGRLYYAVKYGEYEKEVRGGRVSNIMRYRKGTARGYHGLTMRSDVTLEGYEGRCYSFFSRGRLLWQKFTYANGRTAYHIRHNDTEVNGYHPNGVKMFNIKVSHLYFKGKEGEPFLYLQDYGRDNKNYATDGVMCEYTFYDRTGRVKEKGQFENKQRVGEVVKNYRRYFYLSGLEVPKKLYEAKPEDVKPSVVLSLPNAQVRAMFLKKIGYERVIKECEGKVIDTDGKYALIDFPVKYDKHEHNPDKTLRILKVVCPSTKGEYFLKIPPTDDFKTCKRARNGTFTGFDPQAKEVEFAVET